MLVVEREASWLRGEKMTITSPVTGSQPALPQPELSIYLSIHRLAPPLHSVVLYNITVFQFFGAADALD